MRSSATRSLVIAQTIVEFVRLHGSFWASRVNNNNDNKHVHAAELNKSKLLQQGFSTITSNYIWSEYNMLPNCNGDQRHLRN
jgi:hypothetical protein